MTKKSSAEITPFFIDNVKRQQGEAEAKRILKRIATAVSVYEKVTNEQVDTLDDIKQIVENPAKYFLEDRYSKNLNDPKHLIHALLEAGFDAAKLRETIKLPDGFNEIVNVCGLVGPVNWKWFDVVNGNITFSEAFNSRLTNKAYWYTSTSLQQRRLIFAKKLSALIQEQNELLIDECKEANIDISKAKTVIDKALHIGPLPYALKSNADYSTTKPNSEITVRPNEDWVVNGFKMYAYEINLPQLSAKIKLPKEPAPEKYLRFWATDMDGARRAYLIRENIKNEAYAGMRGHEGNVRFEEGEFIIVNGKTVKVE